MSDELMSWTLEVTRKGERESTRLGRYPSQEDAVAAAERLSPRGIHWSVLSKGRIGVTGDCQYLVLSGARS